MIQDAVTKKRLSDLQSTNAQKIEELKGAEEQAGLCLLLIAVAVFNLLN